MSKFLVSRVTVGYGIAIASMASFLISLTTFTQNAMGWLVGTLGLSQATAFAIVALISSGGIDAAVLVYPFLLPFVATIQGLIFVFGTAVLVGW